VRCRGVAAVLEKCKALALSLLPGDLPLPLPGCGVDVWDLRPYCPGDDYRRIDWKATARSVNPSGGRTIIVRVQREERRIATNVVVDISRSMEYKWDLVLWTTSLILSALGRLGDRVYVWSLGRGVERVWHSSSNPTAAVYRLCRVNSPPGYIPLTNLTSLLAEGRRDKVLVVTDVAHSVEEFSKVAKASRTLGVSVGLAIVVSPEDLLLNKRGQLQLFDPETHATVSLSAARARGLVREHVERVRELLRLYRIPNLVVTPGTSALNVINLILRVRSNLV